ncbi:hypothetical protein [Smaragdicoccus niigatensis]|uniref:hypothetical protein n=1 Tax=Smaragdicoccus niigatensis TaxID=359359 RepID=UPI0003768E9C|nr:hypothetical protein [Smaragdicoccus niigatensis]
MSEEGNNSENATAGSTLNRYANVIAGKAQETVGTVIGDGEMAARGKLREEAAQAKRAAARSDTRAADEERAAAEQRRDAIYADRETMADAEREFGKKQREIAEDATTAAEQIAAQEQRALDEKLERIEGRAATTIWRVAEEADQKSSEAAAERSFADAEYRRLINEAEIAEEQAKAHREEAAIYRRFADKATKGH